MPALPSPGAVIKLNMHWRLAGDTLAQTVHYFSYMDGPPSGSTLDAFAAAASSQAEALFSALMPTTWGLDAVTTVDLASDMGAEGSAATPWLGTETGAPLAPASATLVNHQISRRYRGGRPRTYLPLGTAADIASAGIWTTAHTDAVAAAWGDWVAAIVGPYADTTVTAIVNVSYFGPPNRIITGSTGRVRTVSTMRTTPKVDVITGHTVGQLIASQRRRNRDA